MKILLKVIDTISDWTGRNIARFLCLAIVIVVVNEVVRRYVFNSPTMWGYETSLMLGAALYAMGYAYVHRHHGHIRVDVIYTRLSPRARATIDVIGDLLLFFPLFIVLTYTSFVLMWRSWLEHEVSTETMWYPPVAPLRAVVAIGFCLLLLQGIAEFIRDLKLLIRKEPYD